MEAETEAVGVQTGNRGVLDAVSAYLRKQDKSVLTSLERWVDESERAIRLREERSKELEFIAKICSINAKDLSTSIASPRDNVVTRELETYCRIAVSLSKEDNSEDIWNALYDIWCTAYPEQMMALNTEQLSLLHERSLHKLQSLAGAKCLDSIELLLAVYAEIGVHRELIANFLKLESNLN